MPIKSSPIRSRPRLPADYTRDFYTWAVEQGAALREGRFAAIDAENVAEEIESLGREQFSKLRSAYRVILLHLLKWDHQPERRSRSWIVSVVNNRGEIEDVLADNPGLKPQVDDAIREAYRRARREAAAETGLPLKSFPAANPYPRTAIETRSLDLD